jgi:glycosyltransferase involved in cell wall biosynthesis
MNNPKITVLMPVYNTEKFIEKAINSVLNQTFTDFELLIINDGSTDSSLALIQSFTDDRIKVISQPNKGVAAALNNGLTHANADYIARFDADDICRPNRLQVQYDFMLANPDYQIIGSGVDYVSVDGEYIFTYRPSALTYSEILALNPKICPFIHSSVFYKKEVIIHYGGYNEYAYTFEDHLLWANLIRNEKACNLNQSLIKVRLNPDSITIDEKWRTASFKKIKYTALLHLDISKHDGLKLIEIGKRQHGRKIKEGAYYALLGKKYLWNNYQPLKARENLRKTLSISPFHIKNYLLLLISFLPESILHAGYHLFKTNLGHQKHDLSINSTNYVNSN